MNSEPNPRSSVKLKLTLNRILGVNIAVCVTRFGIKKSLATVLFKANDLVIPLGMVSRKSYTLTFVNENYLLLILTGSGAVKT